MTVDSFAEIGRHPVYIGVISTLCVIAILLNLMAIFMVIKFGRCHASVETFFTNLAVSDIIHAGIVTPVYFKSTVVYHEDFFGNNFLCKLIMFIPKVSIMGAILTIVAIAIDRYRAVVTQKHLYRRGALISIALIWLTSVLVSAPQIYEYNVYEDVHDVDSNVTYKSCGSEGIVENFEKVYATSVLIFAFLVPLLVIVVCYTKLLLYVWRYGYAFREAQAQNVGEEPSHEATQVENKVTDRMNKILSTRRAKLLKTLISITATFIGLWTPYFIVFGLTEIMGIDDTSNLAEWPHVVCRTMTVLSTISNPVIFLSFNESSRDALCTMIRGRPTPQLSGRNQTGQTSRE